MRAGEEALELGHAHLLHVLEDHVVCDGLDRGVDLGAGEAQAKHHALGHSGAEAVVAVEADAAVEVGGESAGLADVVEEHGEHERARDLRGQEIEHDAGVLEDIALGVELRRLLAAFERLDLGQDCAEQPAFIEQIEAAHAPRGEQDFHQLFADALGADLADVPRVFTHRPPSRSVEIEAERGREAHGAHHPQAVFADAVGGVTDGAEHARVEVSLAADVVDEPVGEGIEKEAVDREVAALGVLLRRGKADGGGVASVEVLAVVAKGRDLEFAAAVEDHDDAEVRADGDRAAEKRLHLLGARVGGDVVVVRRHAHEPVAHAAAGVERGMPGVVQSLHDAASGDFEGVGHGGRRAGLKRKHPARKRRVFSSRRSDAALFLRRGCGGTVAAGRQVLLDVVFRDDGFRILVGLGEDEDVHDHFVELLFQFLRLLHERLALGEGLGELLRIFAELRATFPQIGFLVQGAERLADHDQRQSGREQGKREVQRGAGGSGFGVGVFSFGVHGDGI